MDKFVRALMCMIVFSLQCMAVCAQQCIVNGTVIDDVSGNPLVGVNITYTSLGKQYMHRTDSNGRYELSIPKGQNIIFKFSHIGYTAQSKLINANANNRRLDVSLKDSTFALTDVVIDARMSILLTRKDTIVYKASAIKSNPDATALDLVRKLPGVSYKDNKLESQGRIVSEIRVDGKEYYKNDIGMALKNLPQEVINDVKVFEELSDYAKLAGFDDGSGTVIFDFSTKKGTNGSLFGKTSDGIGTDGRYTLYGVLNKFGKKDCISLFVQCNNINEQNFSTIDMLSVSGTIANNDPTQSPFSKNAVANSFSHAENNNVSSMMTELNPYGITQTTAAGVNYSGDNKEYGLKFSGHYLYNLSDNATSYDIFDEYFGETTSDNKQDLHLNNRDQNHRFNFKLEYQATPKDYFMIRPSLVMQKRKQDLALTDWTVMESVDSLLLNQNTQTDQSVINTMNEALYMHKFNNRGHALSVNAKFSYTHTDEDMDLELNNVQSQKNVLQKTISKNDQKSYTVTASYVVPISKHMMIKADAGWNYVDGHIKQATETKVNDEQTFSIDSMLCGRANSHYGGFLSNLSYMYNRKRWNVVGGTEFHSYELWTENDRERIIYNYNTLLPFLFIKYLHGNVKWNLQYKTSQKFPTVYQLLEAINNSNAIMSVKGNNRLGASYHHNLSLRLLLTNKDAGNHFVFFTNFEYADNYIASRRSLSSTSFVENGNHRNSEMYSYVNTDGYWSTKGLLAYGFPLRPIKSNINISTMLEYSNIPGYWDMDKLTNRQWDWNAFLTIGSNISKNIDFVFDSNVKYSQRTNMAFQKMDVSYWSLSYGAQLKWLITDFLPLTLECGNTCYYGSGTSQFNAVIANASIGYKFLKKKNAELQILCHDIFNQDNSFLVTTTELYRRQMKTSLLKRYFMLKFTYNFNSIK